MPYTKSALKRYWVIDEALRSERIRYPNRSQLLSEIEQKLGIVISEAMLYKDLKDMRENFGAPISYDRDKKGYYYDYDEYSFRGHGLNQEEQKSLLFVLGILPLNLDENIKKAFESAVKKLVVTD